MSTSGSTGDPKLVRLSHENLSANARAIADFLDLGPHDQGITSLPLHYCYGLSVLHSHLVAGAGVSITTASVVDPSFRETLERDGVTNLAGVPHVFDLLEHAGPDLIRVPTLRFVTQAGGRLAPADVTRWTDRLDGWGARFVVMYGQTEATARMAYLPPELARRHPGAIGVPIDGGSFRIDPIDTDEPADDPGDRADGRADGRAGDRADGRAAEPAVGELVYRGPNVMLGYATTESDLADGRTIDELRTGDLARYHADDGVYEIVGRRARFVKPFGVRIDLDSLERALLERDHGPVVVAGDDDGIVVCAPDHGDPAELADVTGTITGLPARCVIVIDSPIRRTESGKVDYHRTLLDGRRSGGRSLPYPSLDAPPDAVDVDDVSAQVAATYRAVLGRRSVALTDSFVSLGGDSLSYVECSIRLERLLGPLPAGWHLLPIASLAPRRRGRVFARIDTTLPLRALAICLVVATHMRVWFVPGGAHLLLAVAGYNMARFLVPIEPTRARVTAGLRTVARIAVPAVLWVASGLALGAGFGIGTLLLVNNYVGPESHSGDHWHFWFIEVLVHVTLAVTALLAIPAVRRAERRAPYAFVLALLAVLLVLRLDWAQIGDWYNVRFRTHGVAWLVALGWLVQRSHGIARKASTAALCVAIVPGFFQYAPREWFIVASLVLLMVAPEIPFPRFAVRPVAALAAASMWIYITHFTIWPPLKERLDLPVAYLATITLGIMAWVVVERATDALSIGWHTARRRALLAPHAFSTRSLGSPHA